MSLLRSYKLRRQDIEILLFNPSVVDWMEEDLNVSLLSIVRKGRGLSGLNYWRRLEDQVITLIKKY
jgi:hypothetical protein